MKTSIINIGKSQGIILSATFLQKLNLSTNSTVEIGIDNGAIVIKPDPRKGWAEAAQQMSASGEAEPLHDDLPKLVYVIFISRDKVKNSRT